ncbi:helix-turn-helix domain-containing protein [Microbacterium sp. A588]
MKSIDEVVGGNVKTLRQSIGDSQKELASKVSADLRFTRNTIYSIETGSRHCTVADLFALAAALGCTIADLMKSDEPVTFGGTDPVEIDAFLRAPGEEPDARAWSYFENAGDALADVRNAWDRYVTAMDAVRRRVENSAALRERIERIQGKRLRDHADYVVELFEFRPPENFEGYEAYAAANPTPGMVAARDALDADLTLDPRLWRARSRSCSRESSDREMVPSKTANQKRGRS